MVYSSLEETVADRELLTKSKKITFWATPSRNPPKVALPDEEVSPPLHGSSKNAQSHAGKRNLPNTESSIFGEGRSPPSQHSQIPKDKIRMRKETDSKDPSPPPGEATQLHKFPGTRAHSISSERERGSSMHHSLLNGNRQH